jgi:hypothetical protein
LRFFTTSGLLLLGTAFRPAAANVWFLSCWEETRNLTWPGYPDNWGPCDETVAPRLHSGWSGATRRTALTHTEAKVGSGPPQIISYLSIFYLQIARPQPAKPPPPTSRG